MGYVTGTLPNPTPNPAQAIVNALEAEFTAFTGNWEFVETPSAPGQAYRIWRNRGSGVASPNVWGQDFYVGLLADSATSFAIKAHEFWDTTTKKAFRAVNSGANNSITVNADGSSGNIVTGENYGTNATFTGFSGLPTTGLDYHFQVSADRVWMGVRGGANDGCLSFGLFDTRLTTSPAEPFPLYLQRAGGFAYSGFASSPEVQVAFSRHAGPPSPLTNTYLMCARLLNQSAYPLIGGPGSTDNDLFNGGRILVGPSALYSRNLNSTEYGTRGYHRGDMRDMLITAANIGTSRNGDTITFDGVPYILFYDSGFGHRFYIKRDA